ncbi:hypothetical protein G6F61_014992 [Rhizopus arrhizus]|nr:hypothetical protein G6F61_014992 [Rhizopus arrhizus]
MRAALHAAVHHHVDPVTHRVDDLCQLVESAARAVQLTPAVIRQHDAGAAAVDGPLGVFHRHDAFEAKLAVPLPHHVGDVVP